MASKIPLTLTSSLVLLRFIMSICLTITTIYAAPSQTISQTQLEDYLTYYGYLEPVSARNPANGELLDRLDVTDGEKIVRDKVGFGTNSRSKRYVLEGSKWSGKALSYRILEYSKRLSRHDVDETIAKAFSLWSEYTDLTFTSKETGAVNITISFVEGEHDCPEPFDGPNGRIAHAKYPKLGRGEIHFDDSEYLTTISKDDGKDLFEVAAHEIGHALGLEHSDDFSALMAPKYKGNGDVRMHSDDIEGIQAIYGKKRIHHLPSFTTGKNSSPQTVKNI